MSAEAALVSKTFDVGTRYTCTMTIPRPKVGQAIHCAAEWWPQEPRSLTDAEMQAYRAGRASVIAQAAHVFGRPIALVEL